MLDGMTVADAPYVGFAAEALNLTVTRESIAESVPPCKFSAMMSLPAKGPSATSGRAKICPYLPIMSGKPGALYFPDSPAPVHPRKRGGQE